MEQKAYNETYGGNMLAVDENGDTEPIPLSLPELFCNPVNPTDPVRICVCMCVCMREEGQASIHSPLRSPSANLSLTLVPLVPLVRNSEQSK